MATPDGPLELTPLYDSFDELAGWYWRKDKKKEAILLYVMDAEQMWKC